ncbi:MAG: serine/threonine protein kinase [Labilithrix sp.]|nr:serine/threonine protein kinase [Labilithrix sp.]MCW5810733.1 serine/threonine protein kinase [Labilithrix sp.]
MPHAASERLCPNTGLRLEPRRQTADPREARESRDASARAGAPPVVPPPAASKPRVADAPSPGREPTREQEELIGKTINGRYQIKGILGEGGMGTVYDAEHLGLSRQVAVKVLSPSQAKKRVAVKRFQQEARAAGGIGHPNICEVYDLGQLEDGSPFLVMERLGGQTLADRIGKEGGLPYGDVVEIMSQVLSGLVAAHEKGIIHRDIKPENIFLARRVGAQPIIKLLDFGVSKMLPEFQTSEDALDLTRTGMVMGTPYYMSPEQARGERNLDGRVDVYACGVVLYEAIAGKRPFLAPNYNALLLAIINNSPRPLRDYRPNIPPELEIIIARAMAKSRADRYESAKAFLRDLSPVPAAEPSASRLPPPPTPEERRRAPVLGGQASAPRSRRETGPIFEPPRSRRVPEPPPSRPAAPSRPHSDSIDIPIVVDEEDNTEIYQPRHAPPPAPSRPRTTPRWTEPQTHLTAPTAPSAPTAPTAPTAPARSSRPRDRDREPPPPPIVETSGPYFDEMPTTIPDRPASSRRQEPPFNPEETVQAGKGVLPELDRRRRR